MLCYACRFCCVWDLQQLEWLCALCYFCYFWFWFCLLILILFMKFLFLIFCDWYCCCCSCFVFGNVFYTPTIFGEMICCCCWHHHHHFLQRSDKYGMYPYTYSFTTGVDADNIFAPSPPLWCLTATIPSFAVTRLPCAYSSSNKFFLCYYLRWCHSQLQPLWITWDISKTQT